MGMQAAHVWHLKNRAAGWRLCSPRDRRILVQREVSAPLVIIGEEKSKRASQGLFIPDDDVIETLPPQGANQALHERVLPRSPRCDQDLLRAKTFPAGDRSRARSCRF